MTTWTKSREVLVGIDGSPGSRLALEWALDKADRLGEVRAIGTYTVAFPPDAVGLPARYYDQAIFVDAARARLDSILDQTDPSLKAEATVVEGSAGRVLVEASKQSALLVVGCRGRSATTEMLLGSVGSHCVKHAKCPVAVVPDTNKIKGPLRDLVVGVDGSANSKAALRWALDHVEPGGTVIAMMTFTMMIHAFEVYNPPQQELIDQSMKLLESVVEEVATPAERDETVKLDVHIGDPRVELRRAAAEADALVLGARGHRGVAHLLLGSITTSLVHQPNAVTIVVPE